MIGRSLRRMQESMNGCAVLKDKQRHLAISAAKLYYNDDLTMDEIADQLSTSRSSVSRLIAFARREGLVEIRIHAHTEPGHLQLELSRRFGIRALVVDASGRMTGIERLDKVAVAAAMELNSIIESNMTIGIAWGSTITSVSRHLTPKQTANTRFVQLNGAGNILTTGIGYASEILSRFARNYRAGAQQFPVPTLFDDPATKAGMWRERSTKRLLDVQRRMDAAIFSIGSPSAEVPSQVYFGGYLSEEDLHQLDQQQVVGDIATIFFREDGSFAGIPLNARSSGPEFNVLRHTARRICIAADQSKAAGVRGALAAGLITDLIVDESLARILTA